MQIPLTGFDSTATPSLRYNSKAIESQLTVPTSVRLALDFAKVSSQRYFNRGDPLLRPSIEIPDTLKSFSRDPQLMQSADGRLGGCEHGKLTWPVVHEELPH